jgi:hypothetical protein
LKQLWFGLVAVLISVVTPGFAQQEPTAQRVASPEPAAAAYGAPESRILFPHGWVRGHTDFEVAPAHNEPDLGRCSQAPAAAFGGASSPCTAYARWVLSGYIEMQPFGRTLLRHVFLFYTQEFYFGRNVPRYLYTASFDPIMDERILGVGIELPKNFELRLSSHRVDWLGHSAGNLGPADLGTTGPYGNNTTVGLRWNFGGWGHTHE